MSHPSIPDLVPVILAGGAGTRFWPLSTAGRPKQFLHLFGERSLLRLSFERVADLVSPDRILVLTNEAFVPQVLEQLPELPPGNAIGEPVRRDTAAAVALASTLCRRRFGDPVMAVLTADHLIDPVDAFHKALESAAGAARRSEALYTFGIPPSYPAVSFGYLEQGEKILDDGGIEHFRLRRFKEKPDAETAQRYVESGGFLWNSGMFVWTAGAILAEIDRQLPGHRKHLERAVEHDGKKSWKEALRRAFEPLKAISVDFGVMENARDVRCVKACFSWEDVGGWLALEDHLEEDGKGNRRRGRLEALGAERNLVFCDDPEELVALLGVDDLIVIRTGKTTLVTSKDRAEEIKKLVERMEARPNRFP